MQECVFMGNIMKHAVLNTGDSLYWCIPESTEYLFGVAANFRKLPSMYFIGK